MKQQTIESRTLEFRRSDISIENECQFCGAVLETPYDPFGPDGMHCERCSRAIQGRLIDPEVIRLCGMYHSAGGKEHRLSSRICAAFQLEAISERGPGSGGPERKSLAILNSEGIPLKRLALVKNKWRWLSMRKEELPDPVPWINDQNIPRTGAVMNVAGEWDVFAMFDYCGIHAISHPFGEGALPSQAMLAPLMGRDIVVAYDNDDAGAKGASRMAAALSRVANSVRILDLSLLGVGEKGDLDDFFAAGGTIEQLLSAINATEEWVASEIEIKLPNRCVRTFPYARIDYGLPENVARALWDADGLPYLKRREMIDLIVDHWVMVEGGSRSAKRQDLEKAVREMVVMTQREQARAVVQEHHVVTDAESGRVFYYSGGVYQELTDREINAWAAHIQAETTAFLDVGKASRQFRALNEFLRTEIAQTKRVILNKGLNRLVMANGVFDFTSGQLSSHSPEELSTIKSPIAYDPSAIAPNFERALDAWMGPDEQREFKKLMYIILSLRTDIHKAAIFFGDGRDGKSDAIKVIVHLLGVANVNSLSLSELTGGQFNRSRLFGRALNVMPETDYKERINDGVWKTLTGGDRISSDVKFGRDIQFRNITRFIVATNNHLQAPDTSRGFYARLKYFPFKGLSKDERIPSFFENHLEAELPGIFNHAVQGYSYWVTDGGYIETQAEEKVRREARITADSVSSFWEEQSHGPLTDHDQAKDSDDQILAGFTRELNGEFLLNTGQSYTEYFKWAGDAGHQPVSSNEFGRRTKRYLEGVFDGRFRINSEVRRVKSSMEWNGQARPKRVLVISPLD